MGGLWIGGWGFAIQPLNRHSMFFICDGCGGNNTIKLYEPESFDRGMIWFAGDGHTSDVATADVGFSLFSQKHFLAVVEKQADRLEGFTIEEFLNFL